MHICDLLYWQIVCVYVLLEYAIGVICFQPVLKKRLLTIKFSILPTSLTEIRSECLLA